MVTEGTAGLLVRRAELWRLREEESRRRRSVRSNLPCVRSYLPCVQVSARSALYYTRLSESDNVLSAAPPLRDTLTAPPTAQDTYLIESAGGGLLEFFINVLAAIILLSLP